MQPDSNRSTKFQFKIKLTFDSVQIRFIGKSSGKPKLAHPNIHKRTYTDIRMANISWHAIKWNSTL